MQVTEIEERIISLYEIVKILKKEHNKAIKLVDELIATKGFGGVEKKATPTYNPDGSKNKDIETYFFTKRQALIVGGRLDNKNLIKIVDKLEEVTSNKNRLQQYKQPQINSQELAQTVATAVVQAMVQVIPMMSNQETKLDKQKKQLEIDRLQLEKIAMVANLSTKYKLEQLGPLDDIPSELKHQMVLTAGSIVKEVRPAINGISPTACIKQSELKINANDFYKLMNKVGVIEYYEYADYLKGTVFKWKLTERGRYYGYNQHSSSVKEMPYQVKLYSDRFGELLDLLRNENYLN